MVLQLPEPDAADQAFPFDPTTADRAAVDAERDRERRIREDQTRRRIMVALRAQERGYEALIAQHVTVEPGW